AVAAGQARRLPRGASDVPWRSSASAGRGIRNEAASAIARTAAPASIPAVYPAVDFGSLGVSAVDTAYRAAKLKPAPRLKAPAFRPGRNPGFSLGDSTIPSPFSMILTVPA